MQLQWKKDLNFFRAVTFVPGQTNGSELPFEILVWEGCLVKTKFARHCTRWWKNVTCVSILFDRCTFARTNLWQLLQVEHLFPTCLHSIPHKGCGRCDADLNAWIVEQVSCCHVNIIFFSSYWRDTIGMMKTTITPTKKNISIFPALSQSKAFRCHQVLLNHAKNHRKGRDFVSPNAKKAKKVKEMSLDCSYVVGPLFSVVSPTIILFSQLHRFYVPRKSVDDMDTLPMPDFDLENMILECIPSRGQSLAWNFTCSFTPEHVAAYTCIHKHTHLPWPNEDSWWMPCGYCNLHQNPFNMFGMVCCRGNMCCLKNINIYVPHKWVE